jgi:hypothetical protein
MTDDRGDNFSWYREGFSLFLSNRSQASSRQHAEPRGSLNADEQLADEYRATLPTVPQDLYATVFPDVATRPWETIRVEEVQRSSNEPRDIATMYRLLCEKMDDKHAATEEVVRQETASLKRDLLECIKSSPLQAVEIFAKSVLIFGTLSLAVTGISGFDIVNPVVALLSMFSGFAAYGMALIRTKASTREK